MDGGQAVHIFEECESTGIEHTLRVCPVLKPDVAKEIVVEPASGMESVPAAAVNPDFSPWIGGNVNGDYDLIIWIRLW